MIHEDNKKQQPEVQDFSIENFLTDKKKQSSTEQQAVTHREDFAKPQVDEEAIMRVMTGEKPAEIEVERTRPSANNPKKSTSKPKS